MVKIKRKKVSFWAQVPAKKRKKVCFKTKRGKKVCFLTKKKVRKKVSFYARR